MERPTAWLPTRREALGAVTGATLALCGVGHRAAFWRRPASGPIALWAADRAGHAVYGLDADGLVVSRCSVIAPVAVAAGAGGTCVVTSAAGARSAGARTCQRLGAGGVLSQSWSAPPRSDVRQTWGRIVGTKAEPIVATTRPLSTRGSRSVWILRSAQRGGCRLERWVRSGGSDWTRAFLFTFPWSSRAIAGTRSGVWLVGARVPEVRFVTSTGRLVIARRLEDLDGADTAIAARRSSGGGIWIAACGALARLDRTGQRLPGQGGFAHLVALAHARA